MEEKCDVIITVQAELTAPAPHEDGEAYLDRCVASITEGLRDRVRDAFLAILPESGGAR